MTSSQGWEFITSYLHGESCQSSLKIRFENSQLQPSLFIPDLTIEGTEGLCSLIARISPYSRIGMLITVWNQYARQNATLLKSLGRGGRFAKYRLKSSVLGAWFNATLVACLPILWALKGSPLQCFFLKSMNWHFSNSWLIWIGNHQRSFFDKQSLFCIFS